MRPVQNDGAIAQLGERLHGMQEVRGSIPRSSTKFFGHRMSVTCFTLASMLNCISGDEAIPAIVSRRVCVPFV